jgi:hypothetical protein
LGQHTTQSVSIWYWSGQLATVIVAHRDFGGREGHAGRGAQGGQQEAQRRHVYWHICGWRRVSHHPAGNIGRNDWADEQLRISRWEIFESPFCEHPILPLPLSARGRGRMAPTGRILPLPAAHSHLSTQDLWHPRRRLTTVHCRRTFWRLPGGVDLATGLISNSTTSPSDSPLPSFVLAQRGP